MKPSTRRFLVADTFHARGVSILAANGGVGNPKTGLLEDMTDALELPGVA